MKSEGKEWPYWCAALAIFLACAAAVMFFFCEKPDRTYDCVILGDSIYAEKRDENPIAARIFGEGTKTVFNGAMGGTGMARSDEKRFPDERWDAFSMAELSKAIVSGDFSVQRQIVIEEPATEYFGDVTEELAKIDLSKTRILMLGFGMNDYQNGTPLEDPKDPVNEYTYAGALRSVLRSLKKEYPKLRIVLLTPTYSWYPDKEGNCETLDWGGGLLEDYVSALLKIGAELDVETIDLYHDLYETDSFENWSKYVRDGVHPNENGMELIADKIKTYLEEHP